MRYKQFMFEDYDWDLENKTLTLHYGLDDAMHFVETYRFDFDFVQNVNPEALEKAFQLLFYIAGVSYYKTYIPPEIVIKVAPLDSFTADFLSKTYQKGLGEFYYTNKLDPRTPIKFPAQADNNAPISELANKGILLGIGGGKDSLVSAEFLRSQPKIATWSLNHRPQLQPLVERISLPHLWVEREWDKQLLNLNQQDAFNGHVPISAIFACVGTVVAILSGYQDVVVSNEDSASEPSLKYQGLDINHQYSKSLEFEEDYQAVLKHEFGENIRYYSFLRPLTEVRIAELFSRYGFDKYHDVFSSCNRAFTHDSKRLFWDGTCSKCAFVFLAFTPFLERKKLQNLFNGKNLLLDTTLEPIYRQLLGLEGDKPLECVGAMQECRAAMRLAQQKYPELQIYKFDLPEDYDYRSIATHRMPLEVYSALEAKL